MCSQGHWSWPQAVLPGREGWALVPSTRVLSVTSVMGPGRDPTLLLLEISVRPPVRLPSSDH